MFIILVFPIHGLRMSKWGETAGTDTDDIADLDAGELMNPNLGGTLPGCSSHGLTCFWPPTNGNRSVLFLGGSLDRNMVGACHESGLCGKDGADFSFVHLLGARRPYFDISRAKQSFYASKGYLGLARITPDMSSYASKSTLGLIDEVAENLALTTSTPRMVVVSSDTWDLASWWQQAGQPRARKGNYHYKTHFKRWIASDIPNLLQYVKAKFPRSRIVYRSAPVTRGPMYGLSPNALEEMYAYTKEQVVDGKFLGEFEFFDYHDIVDDLLTHHENRGEVFMDKIHPGQEASKLYFEGINQMLTS